MHTQCSWAAATTALASTFFLLFGVIFIVFTATAGGSDALHLLLELGIGDFGRRLDIIGGDDARGGGRGFFDFIAWDTAGDAEKLDNIVELAVEVSTDGDGGRYRLDVGFWSNGALAASLMQDKSKLTFHKRFLAHLA